jgi:hypothetical protein
MVVFWKLRQLLFMSSKLNGESDTEKRRALTDWTTWAREPKTQVEQLVLSFQGHESLQTLFRNF